MLFGQNEGTAHGPACSRPCEAQTTKKINPTWRQGAHSPCRPCAPTFAKTNRDLTAERCRGKRGPCSVPPSGPTRGWCTPTLLLRLSCTPKWPRINTLLAKMYPYLARYEPSTVPVFPGLSPPAGQNGPNVEHLQPFFLPFFLPLPTARPGDATARAYFTSSYGLHTKEQLI